MEVDASRDPMAVFNDVPDPRAANRRHRLVDVLGLTILAILSNCDDWVAIELWGQDQEAWLREVAGLRLVHGIPTHDTLGRLFAKLKPQALEQCFTQFMNELAKAVGGKLIQIDGKCLRGSFDRAGNKAAIHMVNAWCHTNRMVLGQLAVEDKSNEITAIPRLLQMLDLRGALVSIDAMGCQKEIAKTIVNNKGDYLLAVKDNHKTLHEDIRLFFDEAIKGQWEGVRHQYCQTVDGDHGRIETRRCWVTNHVKWLKRQGHDWAGLKGLACVESQRLIKGQSQASVERRIYITSTDPCLYGADGILDASRTHWSVENRVHWSLDVSFQEDASRVRKGHAPENLARMRRMALNLLRRMPVDKPKKKVSMRNRRQMCARNPSLALKALVNQE